MLARDKLNALRRTELFRGLPEPLLSKIAGLAVSKELNRDEILFSEEDEAAGLFVIADGELRSIRQDGQGRQQVLSTERTGAVLAAVAVLSGGTYYSTMVADCESQVLCIHLHHMRCLCHEHPELLWSLAKVLAGKVRQHAELIESLAFRNVDQRVAQVLLNVQQDAPNSGEYVIELSLTRSDIASRVGSAREAVSRALTHLHELGLIEMVNSRTIRVPDVRALQTFAGRHDPELKRAAVTELSSQIA